jgi:hypothetical protein
MRKIEPAAPGDQEFAANGRHVIIDRHSNAGGAQHFGRHQTRRPAADDGDLQDRIRRLLTIDDGEL